jgi:hypothetical protein
VAPVDLQSARLVPVAADWRRRHRLLLEPAVQRDHRFGTALYSSLIRDPERAGDVYPGAVLDDQQLQTW